MAVLPLSLDKESEHKQRHVMNKYNTSLTNCVLSYCLPFAQSLLHLSY
jgi:hypothetical protein